MKTLILSLFASASVALAGYAPRAGGIDQANVAVTGGTINGTAIGGSAPASGSFTAVTVSNSPLSAMLLQAAATNASDVPDSGKELVIKNGQDGSNAAAFWNTSNSGYSAIAFRDKDGNEVGATGYGNGGSAPIFRGANYCQTWAAGVPPCYQITADGNYGNVGSGFRFYRRFAVDWDSVNGEAFVAIYHHIPWGTTQYPAFKVVTKDNVQNFCKIVQTSTDSSFQLWKDATPSKAVAIGLSMPGVTPGNDIVFAAYTGSAWVERMRLKNGAAGTASLNLPGLPTSSSGLASGDVYSNAGILTIVP